MAEFSGELETAEGLVRFTFSRIYTVNGPVYFTTAVQRTINHNFHMVKNEGAWKIAQASMPPNWILSCEAELARIIEAHHQG
ncbi:MAG: hypothetical protein EOO14_07215 [Chitinophagaceae bacterium]|nr:MAG: hypothetical protein EOO14_07215 [Chitinophagaceae bacterium]